MKPKPFSSLNHFTVPVAICSLPGLLCAATREVLMQPRYERWHDLPGRSPGAMNIKCTGAFGVVVIRLGAFADCETEDDYRGRLQLNVRSEEFAILADGRRLVFDERGLHD